MMIRSTIVFSPFVRLSLYVLMCSSFWCCQRSVTYKDAIIKGDLKDQHSFLEGKKLYLFNAETRIAEDSCLINKGKFQFTVDATENFTAHKVSIVYNTGNKAWPYLSIGFINPYFANTYESTCYLEKGTTDLYKDSSFKPDGMAKICFSFVDIKPQTLAAYKHLLFKFDQNPSLEQNQYNRKLIRHYSYSVELLNILNLNKDVIAQEELTNLLSLFDQSLHNTDQYKNLLFYIGYQNKNGTSFPTEISLKKIDRSL